MPATPRSPTSSRSSSGGDGVVVVGGEEVEDAARPEHGIHAAALEHDAHALRQPPVVGDRVEPEHANRPGGGASVALEHLDRRRLPGAVGTEHDQHLAGLGAEVDLVDGGRSSGRVAHGEPADLDGGHDVAGYFEQG